MDAKEVNAQIQLIVENVNGKIKRQLQSRTTSAAQEVRNATQFILSGERHGRRYRKPGTFRRQRDKVSGRMRNGVYYTASAPGEAPANRTGNFRLSFKKGTVIDQTGKKTIYHAKAESDMKVKNGMLLGEILEQGTRNGKLAPRPYKQKTIDRALPTVEAIYKRPYTR